MGMIENWKSVLMQPTETFAKRKKDARIGEACKTYAILGGLFGLLYGVMIALLAAFVGAVANAGPVAGLGFLAIPVGGIFGAIFGVIASLFQSGVYFIFAKLLGGKGDFKTHYFLPSLFAIPVTVLVIASMLLMIIPPVGMLVIFALSVYAWYLMTLALREAHGFSTLKAVLVWLLPVILAFILMVVVLGAFFAAVLSAAMAAKAA